MHLKKFSHDVLLLYRIDPNGYSFTGLLLCSAAERKSGLEQHEQTYSFLSQLPLSFLDEIGIWSSNMLGNDVYLPVSIMRDFIKVKSMLWSTDLVTQHVSKLFPAPCRQSIFKPYDLQLLIAPHICAGTILPHQQWNELWFSIQLNFIEMESLLHCYSQLQSWLPPGFRLTIIIPDLCYLINNVLLPHSELQLYLHKACCQY